MSAIVAPRKPIVYYPDSDGEPMSDNTIQFRWIVTLQGNLDAMYREVPNVFVAGDHLIYAIEGEATIRQAPDVYVAFGRPKGDRGSYKVWEEGGIFPQVVFEVWSPNNRFSKMQDKLEFYQRYGAEEYYILYPEFPMHVEAWRRNAGRFVQIETVNGWISPLLNIRFQVQPNELVVYRPDGSRFLSFLEQAELAQAANQRAAEATRLQEAERERAETEKLKAEEQARLRAIEQERANRLASRLRELGGDPDAI